MSISNELRITYFGLYTHYEESPGPNASQIKKHAPHGPTLPMTRSREYKRGWRKLNWSGEFGASWLGLERKNGLIPSSCALYMTARKPAYIVLWDGSLTRWAWTIRRASSNGRVDISYASPANTPPPTREHPWTSLGISVLWGKLSPSYLFTIRSDFILRSAAIWRVSSNIEKKIANPRYLRIKR